jgi:hypothetical protein
MSEWCSIHHDSGCPNCSREVAEKLRLGPVTPEEIERIKREAAECPKLGPAPEPEEPRGIRPELMYDVISKWDEYTRPEPVVEGVPTEDLMAEVEEPVGCWKDDTKKEPVTAILVVYLQVGQLSPFKVEAFVERVKDQWKPLTDRFPGHVGLMVVPTRSAEHIPPQVIEFPKA